jgi:hypothetical protein
MASEIQLIKDNVPQYIHNKHTTYENTMLNVFSSIVGSLKDTDTSDVLLENQGRLFIGGLLKDKAEKFISDNYQNYYDEIFKTIKARTSDDQKRITNTRVWERLITDAFGKFIKDHHVDHTKAKIAAIDRFTPDGKELVEICDVEFLPPEDFHKPGYLRDHPKTRAVWSYAQYVAKQVTGPKNIDKKIFIVGDAGDGKSVTGLMLAIRIAFWIAYYVNLNLIKQNKPPTAKPEDYFTLDKDHIACIISEDLIHVATVELPQHSIKILDDLGSALGFTNRRSMSGENLDMVSIIGTNRVKNGVTIYCVHTEDFADVRVKLLANEKIDMTDYVQSPGGYRIGKLYKMKRVKKNKSVECKFGFWSNGEYCTIEGIICFMPGQTDNDRYSNMRVKKEQHNTSTIREKYKRIAQAEEIKNEKPRCPHCNSTKLYHSKKGTVRCNGCGKYI